MEYAAMNDFSSMQRNGNINREQQQQQQQQESKDNLSSSGGGVVKAISGIGNGGGGSAGGSWLVSKRVSSAGALVRQQTATASPSSSNITAIAQSQQKLGSPSSDRNLWAVGSVEKLRLMDSDATVIHHGKEQEETKCVRPAQTVATTSRKQTVDVASNGVESLKPMLNIGDYNELKLRYASMENAYEADRKKTSVLLSKKDAHIIRLQDRVASLEQRLDAASQRNPDNNHGLIAERDALLDKLQRLEAAFVAEKLSWESRLAAAERISKTKESTGWKIMDGQSKSDCNFPISPKPPNLASPSSLCANCAYFRRQLERIEKNTRHLLSEKEQSQQESQRKETVLSELSAEATELRVQLNMHKEERAELKRKMQQMENEMHPIGQHQNGAGQKRSMDGNVGTDEYFLLRKRLNEAQDYFEAMDIESEQQITNLTNQLEESHSQLEQKQRDITLLHNQLKESEYEREKAQGKIKTCENNYSRQQDVIESLREELDRQKDKNREMGKERDDLLLRNAALSHEVELFKRETQNQRDEIHAHLTEVSRELEQCKVKLREQEACSNDGGNGKLFNANRRIDELEEALRDRETTIQMQQQRLGDMKRALQKEWISALDTNPPTMSNSMPFGLDIDSNTNGGGTGFGLQSKNVTDERLMVHFQHLKNVILRFVTSTDYEATQLVRAVAALLCLSPEEEQLLWDSLKWKTTMWTPQAKPKLVPHTP